MPPPTNQTAATAIDLGILPADVTQNVHDAGITYTVWYKFTAPAGSIVIGAWGFSDIAAVYRANLSPYSDEGITQILAIAGENIPIQFPVTAGNTYWLRFLKNGGNTPPASLRIRVEVAPTNTISGGNILVNDDADGFPLAVLSHITDYTVVNFVKNMPSGESGDITHSSPIAILLGDEFAPAEFVLLDGQFAIIAHIPILNAGNLKIRANQTTGKFYIGNEGFGGTNAQFRTVSKTGILGSIVTLTHGIGMKALAANNDDTILYFSTGLNAPIKRWDIPGGVMLSDFAAAVAGYISSDILVSRDGTIIISFFNLTTNDLFIRRYDSLGTIQNTYNFGIVRSTLPRLAYALDNPNSFWVWVHPTGVDNGKSKFMNVKTSDGTILTTRLHAEYESGAYVPGETATPLARFGNSFSCPFLIMQPPAGMFVIVTDKRNDSNGTTNVAIPNPTFSTALMP